MRLFLWWLLSLCFSALKKPNLVLPFTKIKKKKKRKEEKGRGREKEKGERRGGGEEEKEESLKIDS